jgi:hypothetical protein
VFIQEKHVLVKELMVSKEDTILLILLVLLQLLLIATDAVAINTAAVPTNLGLVIFCKYLFCANWFYLVNKIIVSQCPEYRYTDVGIWKEKTN